MQQTYQLKLIDQEASAVACGMVPLPAEQTTDGTSDNKTASRKTRGQGGMAIAMGIVRAGFCFSARILNSQ